MSRLWLVGLVAVVVLFVGAMVLQAQDTGAPADQPAKKGKGMRGAGGGAGGAGGGGMGGGRAPIELTDAQKTKLEKPHAAIKAALEEFQKVVAAEITDEAQARRYVMQFVMQTINPAGARGARAPKAPDASVTP